MLSRWIALSLILLSYFPLQIDVTSDVYRTKCIEDNIEDENNSPNDPNNPNYFLLSINVHVLNKSGHLLKKRSIMQFGDMIESYTGKKAMDFNGYGQYCGFGGSGEPVDAIDRCCMAHDKCYHLVQHLCFFLLPKVYILHYGWISNKSGIICYNRNWCKKFLCHCDSIAVRCFAKNLDCYNSKYLSSWGKVFQTFFGKNKSF